MVMPVINFVSSVLLFGIGLSLPLSAWGVFLMLIGGGSTLFHFVLIMEMLCGEKH